MPSQMQEKYTINTQYPSENFNERPLEPIQFLILHYTAAPLQNALNALTQKGNTSSHYLVPELKINNRRIVYQLVEENKRAWHAGVSAWDNKINLNNTSIGIEIVNLGFTYNHETKKTTWFPYPEEQIDTLILLCQNIIQRHNILPQHVLGHADVAPGRKFDPGLLFPWQKLAQYGIGAWVDEEEIKELSHNISEPKNRAQWQEKLQDYGYNINITNKKDAQTLAVLNAFQMHFRPHAITQDMDFECYKILCALIKKYKQTPFIS